MFDFIVVVIAVRVRQAEQAGLSLADADDVEAAESFEQAVGLADFDWQLFDFCFGVLLSDGRNDDPVERALPVRRDQPAFAVDTQRDP